MSEVLFALVGVLFALFGVLLSAALLSSRDPAKRRADRARSGYLAMSTFGWTAIITVAILAVSRTVPLHSPPSARPTEAVTSAPSQWLPAEFVSRCAEATSVLDESKVYFREQVQVDRGEPHRYRLAIGPETPEGPAARLGLPVQDEALVTCAISARLVADSEVSIEPEGWQEATYLPPDPVEWTWLVTPTSAGDHPGTLQIYPIVRVDLEGSIEVLKYGTRSYAIQFSASESVWQRVVSEAASLQNVLAAAAAAAAVIAALQLKKAAAWIRRRLARRKLSRDADGESREGYY